jgi:hypothetical protein
MLISNNKESINGRRIPKTQGELVIKDLIPICSYDLEIKGGISTDSIVD